MRQINSSAYFLLATSVLFQLGCSNNATTSSPNDRDTTSVYASRTDSVTMPAYDPAMDPLTKGGEMTKKRVSANMQLMRKKLSCPMSLFSPWPVHICYEHLNGCISNVFAGVC